MVADMIEACRASIEVSSHKGDILNSGWYLQSIKAGELIGINATLKSFVTSDEVKVDSIEAYIVNGDSFLKPSTEDDILDDSIVGSYNIDGWSLIIVQAEYQKFRQLKERGGFRITHCAVITRSDGEPFNAHDSEPFVDALSWMFRFIWGRKVGIPLRLGMNGAQQVWQKYTPVEISSWSPANTWFGHSALPETLYPYVIRKLQDSLWSRSLNRVIEWYVVACESTSLAGSIVSIQVALETLGWTYLVQQESSTLDAAAYDKLRASDILRLLLDQCSIGRVSPGEFHESLRQYADGAHLVTAFRNSIVHPKIHENFERYEKSVQQYVRDLGLTFLELILLYVLEYNDVYTSRYLEPRHQFVPWARRDGLIPENEPAYILDIDEGGVRITRSQ